MLKYAFIALPKILEVNAREELRTISLINLSQSFYSEL